MSPTSWQFIRFLAAGGIAAAANFGSRFGYSLAMPYEAAIISAYLTGMIVAFVLMRGHVFMAVSGQVTPQALKFTLVNLLAVTQTLIISLVLARWALPRLGIVEHSEALAHLIGVAVPVLTSYLGHKHLTFK